MIAKNLLLQASVDNPAKGGRERLDSLPNIKKPLNLNFEEVNKSIDIHSNLEEMILNVITLQEASPDNGAATGLSVVDSKKVSKFNQCISEVLNSKKINPLNIVKVQDSN